MMKMDPRKLEALFSWVAILWLIGYIVLSFFKLDFWWALVGIGALFIVLSSMISKMNPFEVMPFELIIILIIPLYIHASGYYGFFSRRMEFWDELVSLTGVMAYSVIGMFIIAEIQAFTNLKMNRIFAVLFVTIFSLAASGIWSIFEYISDSVIGTSLISDNYAIMMRFIYASIGGILIGIFFDLYLKFMPDKRLERFGLDSLRGGPIDER